MNATPDSQSGTQPSGSNPSAVASVDTHTAVARPGASSSTAGRPSANQRSIQRNLMVGLVLAFALVGVGGVWASTTEIAGAVIAQGQLVVESSVKKVQHPTGGVVGELRVRDGDHVHAGDILLRLDDTQTRASLAIVSKGLDEFRGRKAREEAERDGADTISLPDEFRGRTGEPELARVIGGEQRLFETRRAGREGQKAQLRERIQQLREEVVGLQAQVEGKDREIRWIQKELEGVRELWSKQLVQFTRVTALERDAARLEGERGGLIASIAQTNGKMTETELQILQVDQDMRTEVGKDLSDLRGKISEYEERKTAAEDQLKRIDLRAPQDGVVYQLDVHTVGGVISAGQPVMSIVPNADVLRAEAKVQPQDIDQLHLGQRATMRFTAFSQRTTPEVNGVVAMISPDVSTDPKTGAPYYIVRVTVPESEVARAGGLHLVPGMPVEIFIQTVSRTVVSYVTTPFTDQLRRAFRQK
jgi:HlyD family secretion protein